MIHPSLPLRVGVLSFAHYHANFWSEVFAAHGVLAGIWDDDATRGADAARRFDTRYAPALERAARNLQCRGDLQRDRSARGSDRRRRAPGSCRAVRKAARRRSRRLRAHREHGE